MSHRTSVLGEGAVGPPAASHSLPVHAAAAAAAAAATDRTDTRQDALEHESAVAPSSTAGQYDSSTYSSTASPDGRSAIRDSAAAGSSRHDEVAPVTAALHNTFLAHSSVHDDAVYHTGTFPSHHSSPHLHSAGSFYVKSQTYSPPQHLSPYFSPHQSYLPPPVNGVGAYPSHEFFFSDPVTISADNPYAHQLTMAPPPMSSGWAGASSLQMHSAHQAANQLRQANTSRNRRKRARGFDEKAILSATRVIRCGDEDMAREVMVEEKIEEAESKERAAEADADNKETNGTAPASGRTSPIAPLPAAAAAAATTAPAATAATPPESHTSPASIVPSADDGAVVPPLSPSAFPLPSPASTSTLRYPTLFELSTRGDLVDCPEFVVQHGTYLPELHVKFVTDINACEVRTDGSAGENLANRALEWLLEDLDQDGDPVIGIDAEGRQIHLMQLSTKSRCVLIKMPKYHTDEKRHHHHSNGGSSSAASHANNSSHHANTAAPAAVTHTTSATPVGAPSIPSTPYITSSSSVSVDAGLHPDPLYEARGVASSHAPAFTVPSLLRSILEDDTIMKSGAELWGDSLDIYRDLGVATNNGCNMTKSFTSVLSLEVMVNLALAPDQIQTGVAAAAFKKDKVSTTSTWDADHLTLRQLVYAALDGQTSYIIGKHLRRPPPFHLSKLSQPWLQQAGSWLLMSKYMEKAQEKELRASFEDMYFSDTGLSVLMNQYNKRIRLGSDVTVHLTDGTKVACLVAGVNGKRADLQWENVEDVLGKEDVDIERITLTRKWEDTLLPTPVKVYLQSVVHSESENHPIVSALLSYHYDGPDIADPTLVTKDLNVSSATLQSLSAVDQPQHQLPAELRHQQWIHELNESQQYAVALAMNNVITTIQGPPGSGKCWGWNTRMLMFDGRTKFVQDIKEGDMLMGDDNTPRIVQAGSLTRGHTAADAAGSTPDAATYRITSHNAGRESWTCNGDHILVLKWNHPPTEVKMSECDRGRGHTKPFYYAVTAVGDENRVVIKPFHFDTEREADHAREQAIAEWEPLVWEGSVDEFLTFDPILRATAQMYQPALVDFVSQGVPLRTRLSHLLDRQASEEEAKLTAWVIGVWLADGVAGTSCLSQVKECQQKSSHAHTAVIEHMKQWYQLVTDRVDEVPPATDSASCSTDEDESDEEIESITPGIMRFGQYSTTGNALYQVNLGSHLSRLLAEYQVLFKQHIPHDLLAESAEIRMALLAGIIDGVDDTNIADREIEVSAKKRRFIDGVIHLARGLGFSTSQVGKETCTNEETGEVYRGFRVRIIGADLHKLDMAPHQQKRFAASDSPNQDHRCGGFTVTKIAHAAYYGFTLDGNGRCLMGDFVVSHNTSTIAAIVRTLICDPNCKILCVARTNTAARHMASACAKFIGPHKLTLQVSQEFFCDWHESQYCELLEGVEEVPASTLTVTVRPSDPVDVLYTAIATRSPLSPSEIYLLFGGKPVHRGLIGDYGLQEGSTLDCMLRQPGTPIGDRPPHIPAPDDAFQVHIRLPSFRRQRGSYVPAMTGSYDNVFRDHQVLVMTTGICFTRPELTQGRTVVILDEGSQIWDLEAILFLRAMDCLEKLILFGDSKQLSCYVAPEWRVSANSILDLANLAATRARLFPQHWADTGLLEVKQCMLNVQYRMIRHLGDMISSLFYDGVLRSADNSTVRAVTWHDVRGFSQADEQFSVYNLAEVDEVIRLWRHLCAHGYRPDEIVIISMYEAQRQKLAETGVISNARIYNVDSFQGQESPIIILSLGNNILTEFLKDSRRVNVACSRAQQRLYIVGDLSTFSVPEAGVWYHIAKYAASEYKPAMEVPDLESDFPTLGAAPSSVRPAASSWSAAATTRTAIKSTGKSASNKNGVAATGTPLQTPTKTPFSAAALSSTPIAGTWSQPMTPKAAMLSRLSLAAAASPAATATPSFSSLTSTPKLTAKAAPFVPSRSAIEFVPGGSFKTSGTPATAMSTMIMQRASGGTHASEVALKGVISASASPKIAPLVAAPAGAPTAASIVASAVANGNHHANHNGTSTAAAATAPTAESFLAPDSFPAISTTPLKPPQTASTSATVATATSMSFAARVAATAAVTKGSGTPAKSTANSSHSSHAKHATHMHGPAPIPTLSSPPSSPPIKPSPQTHHAHPTTKKHTVDTDSPWTCAACSFDNVTAERYCEVCQSDRFEHRGDKE